MTRAAGSAGTASDGYRITEEPYSFLGHVLRDGMSAKFPDNLVLRDERDGALIVRLRTEQAKCRCSHAQPAHGTDRRGRPACFGSVMCACTSFRLKEDQ